jgi:hypothetical protein
VRLSISIYRQTAADTWLLRRIDHLDTTVIKIGHMASAHVRLDESDGVSRMHAVISVEPDNSMTIFDLGSDAGTFLDGKKVIKGRFHPGSEVIVGRVRLVFGAGQPAELAAAAEAEASGDLVTAIQLADAILAVDSTGPTGPTGPTNAAALDLLERLLPRTESWDRLARLLEARLAAEESADRRERLAQIYENKLGDLTRAAELRARRQVS